jgi:hypothetical protein
MATYNGLLAERENEFDLQYAGYQIIGGSRIDENELLHDRLRFAGRRLWMIHHFKQFLPALIHK